MNSSRLIRQYAIRRLRNDEIKNILCYFKYDLNKNVPLRNVIDDISKKFVDTKLKNEKTNMNIQFLQYLYITRPDILNINISQLN
jgi:hypothetical protein